MEISQRVRARKLNFIGKITLLVAATLILTGLINWVLSGFTFYQTMRDEVLEGNRRTAETLARRVEDMALSGINLLSLVAADTRPNWNDPRGVQAALEQYGSLGGFFDELSFIAADGRLRAVYPLDGEAIGIDLSGSDSIRQVLAGRRAYVSDAFMIRTGRLMVAISVPVLDGRGRRFGVLSGKIDLRSNNTLSRLLDNISLGRGGTMALVDRRGRILYHPDPAMLMRGLAANKAVQQVLAGREGTMEGLDEGGQRVLAAFSRFATRAGG